MTVMPQHEVQTSDRLADPLPLPCGEVLVNRICKAAMTEGLADPWRRATPRHERLYRTWSHGGAGLLITGNVMVDRWALERPGNVVIDPSYPPTVDAEALARLRAWASAGTEEGSGLWMQISHAGRQSPRYVAHRPAGPSAVQLDAMGYFGRPRSLTEPEILELVQRFGHAAVVARETGFTGVQVHAAHGYLISSFLSPVVNRRSDDWGGSLQNRARLLLEVVRSVRRSVGPDFPVSVKLNSDDFRKGGFSHEECLAVVRWLNDEAVDLLEISGGSLEQPRLLGLPGRAADAVAVRPSTRAREAYFLAYAESIRGVATMPLMVTGGFRTRAAMEAALDSGATDVIGIARPFCTDPDSARGLLDRRIDTLPAFEQELHLRRSGRLSPTSPWIAARIVNLGASQGWYYEQMRRLADGRPVEHERRVLRSFGGFWWNEVTCAARLRR